MAARSRKAARVSSVALVTAGAMLALATSAGASVQAVAHRGGSDTGPEQALSTFKHAISVKTDAIEFDVRFTKDGVPVLVHDRTVDRMTTCTGAVNTLTWAKLQKCTIEVKHGSPAGQKVPSLDQALKVIAPSKTKIYVHVKSGSPSEAKKIMKTINKYHLDTTGSSKNRVVVMADTTTILRNLKLAGAHRRGLVFHNADGWKANYSVLIARGTPVTRKLVAKAQKAGRFVIAVEGWPVKASQVAGLGLNGFMADDLDDYLIRDGRMEDPKVVAARLAAEKAAAEKAAAAEAAEKQRKADEEAAAAAAANHKAVAPRDDAAGQ